MLEEVLGILRLWKMRQLVITWVIWLVFLPAFAVTEGQLGIQDIPLGPDAIVMQDSSGQDVVVVFYRLQGDSQRAAFVVGRAQADSAKLIWDDAPYTIKSTVMMAGGFSPAPVLLNNKLYLFGRNRTHGDGRHFIYNYFENLDDLIAHTTDGDKDRPFQDLGIKGHQDHDHLSAAAVPGDDAILLAYHAKHETKKNGKTVPSSLRCEPKQNSALLSCQHVLVESHKHKQPAELVPISFPDDSTAVLWLMRDDKYLGVHHYDEHQNTWMNFQSSAKLNLPPEMPVGAVSFNHELYLYYKEDKKSAPIMMTKASVVTKEPVHDEASPSEPVVWSKPIKLHDPEGNLLMTAEVVKPIVYHDRIYIFYLRNIPDQQETGVGAGPNGPRPQPITISFPDEVFYWVNEEKRNGND